MDTNTFDRVFLLLISLAVAFVFALGVWELWSADKSTITLALREWHCTKQEERDIRILLPAGKGLFPLPIRRAVCVEYQRLDEPKETER